MPCHPADTVVRIVRHGVESGEGLFKIRDPVAIAVPYPEDAAAFRKINPAISAENELHRRGGLIVKNAPVFSDPIEDEDFVMLGTFVAFGPKVGVRGDDKNIPLFIDIDSCRCHQIRVFGKEGEFYTGLADLDLRRNIVGNNWGGRSGEGGKWGEQDEDEAAHGGVV